MKTANEPIKPFGFLQRLRENFPQFDQIGEGGGHSQQDAEECMTQILGALNNKVIKHRIPLPTRPPICPPVHLFVKGSTFARGSFQPHLSNLQMHFLLLFLHQISIYPSIYLPLSFFSKILHISLSLSPFLPVSALLSIYPSHSLFLSISPTLCILISLLRLASAQCKINSQGAVDELFGIEMDVKIKCAEPGCEEPEETKVEKLTKLSCHIEGAVAVGDGTNKGGTDMLPQAILKGLEDSFEKISPTLGRSALYNKSLRIKKLPKYLITQLVRFYYRRDTQKKAKILRSVKFPMMLDMKEYCTEEYQSRIEKFREQALAKQEAEKEAKKKQKRGEAPDAGAAEGTAPAAAAPAGDDVMDVDLSGDENLWANYECTGVLTHQVGRALSLNLVVDVMIASGIWACRMCFLAFGSGSELGFGLLFGSCSHRTLGDKRVE